MPTVSVIMPAYNQSEYLGEAIVSVLGQTYQDFEMIVVDDGSTDNTAEVVHSFWDKRLSYIYQENRGLSAARNTGILHATSLYLTFLDSDDLFLPEKLEILLNEMENHPELGLVAGQAIPIDEKGRRIGRRIARALPEDASKLLITNPLHVGSVLLRKCWQESAGLFDESLRACEDWDLWIRLAKLGCKMKLIERPVSLYRFHQAQMTRDEEHMFRAMIALVEKTFKSQDVPESWWLMRDRAYSAPYLEAAAQAYRVNNIQSAIAKIERALSIYPELGANSGEEIENRIYAWTSDPRTEDKLSYINTVYKNLPDSLRSLRQRRRQALGQVAIRLAFENFYAGNLVETRYFTWWAFLYQPKLIFNRGAVSIFIRSLLKG